MNKMKTTPIVIISFLLLVLSTNAVCEMVKFSPAPWCDVTLPKVVFPGQTIEMTVDYKGLGDTFLNCNLGYKKGKGGGYLATGEPNGVKISGTGTQVYTATIPADRFGMTGVLATIWQSPDGSWKTKTADANSKPVPVNYSKSANRPKDNWHEDVSTQSLKLSEWCNVIVPDSTKMEQRMNVTVQFNDLEETYLTCTLYYVLKDGRKGFLSSAIQGPELVKGSGENTYYLPVLKHQSLKAVTVAVFLSKEDNWRTKTKIVHSTSIPIK